MAKTSYFTSALGSGELLGIRSDDRALTAPDLTDMDTEAMHRVNNLILALSGPTNGAAIVAEFTVDANAVDPIFVIIAEKVAAAEAWHRWEQFNLGVVAREDVNHRRDSERLRAEVESIVKQLEAAKATLKADGTVRPLPDAEKASGPVVGGPMANGSLFVRPYYYDERNRQYPSNHADPYHEAT
jgi:hypothetical protein